MPRPVLKNMLSLALLACSSQPPPPPAVPAPCPPDVPSLRIAASPRINGTGTDGFPVRLRLYQLKSDTRLRNTRLGEVWQNGPAVLESDLLKFDEYTVYPGQSEVVKVELDPAARQLAAVASFRDPPENDWFVSYDIEPPPNAAPCPAPRRLSLWLDRMQIQDGEGKIPDAPAAQGATPAGASQTPTPEGK